MEFVSYGFSKKRRKNKMNKIIIMLLGIFLLTGVTAIVTLSNGNKILSDDELASKTDEQIQSYMENNLEMTRYKLLDEKIIVYYNITYVEPSHSSYFDNSTNETIDKPYRVFTQEKPFTISKEIWEKCTNKTTKQNCRDYLVDRETVFHLVENVSITEGNETTYEITNTTIKSVYLQAQEEQIKQYARAIKFRDKAINNDLEELVNLI